MRQLKVHWWDEPCHNKHVKYFPRLTGHIKYVTCLTCLGLMLDDYQFSQLDIVVIKKTQARLRPR